MKKKVLTWTCIILLVLMIAYRPFGMAKVFKALGGGLVDIATGVGDFFTNLAS